MIVIHLININAADTRDSCDIWVKSKMAELLTGWLRLKNLARETSEKI